MYKEYEDHMTEKMLVEVRFIDEMIEPEILRCIQNANACAEAMADLPATAVSGNPVVHGANKDMDSLVDYWVARLRAASYLVSITRFCNILKATELHPIVDRKLGSI